MKELFDKISDSTAVVITKKYSTSFSIAVRLLAPCIRQAVYNVYGFVRVADEIVDSFKGYQQEQLLDRFEDEYHFAEKHGISSNPVINAFQRTVEEYNIDKELVSSFLKSMRADLTKQVYTTDKEIKEYIYGSADVVGLMCLKIFVQGDQKKYEALVQPAMKLGSAFQKVNFLRDFKADYEGLSRTYFPNVDPNKLTKEGKKKIIIDIEKEFKEAVIGIKSLPKEARLGVYVAYMYYLRLLKKIDNTPATALFESRIRVSNSLKTYLLCKSYIKYQFNIV
jgi:phytoene/squalene synthetase